MENIFAIAPSSCQTIPNPATIACLNTILDPAYVAILIDLDTFKNELSKYLPFLNLMLNNFYEIIADINSFIKDLIR